jgi:hypothetical protein
MILFFLVDFMRVHSSHSFHQHTTHAHTLFKLSLSSESMCHRSDVDQLRRHDIVDVVCGHVERWPLRSCVLVWLLTHRQLLLFPWQLERLTNLLTCVPCRCAISDDAADPCLTVPAAVANGVVSACANSTHNVRCVPACNSGYSSVDAYTCVLGFWSGAPTCARKYLSGSVVPFPASFLSLVPNTLSPYSSQRTRVASRPPLPTAWATTALARPAVACAFRAAPAATPLAATFPVSSETGLAPLSAEVGSFHRLFFSSVISLSLLST